MIFKDEHNVSLYLKCLFMTAIVINGKVVDAGPNMSRARLKELVRKAGCQET